MRKRFFIAIAFFITVLAFSISLAGVWHYPRIVRSAYLSNPWLLPKVLYYQNFPGKGKNSNDVVIKILNVDPAKARSLSLYYLDASPRSDKPIRERYFSLFSKLVLRTDEELFWEYKGPERHVLIEYKTGRTIYESVNGRQITPRMEYPSPDPTMNSLPNKGGLAQ